jgi:hypothetical protein
MRQTPHIETISLNTKATITQQNKKITKKTSINGKIQQENSRGKSALEAHTQSASDPHPAPMNHIRRVSKRREKKPVSIGHNGIGEKRVVGIDSLGQRQKSRLATQGVDLSFSAKYL